MNRPARFGWWKSTTRHFVLLHLALSLACILPVMLFVYAQTDRILLRDFQRPLEVRKDNLLRHYARGGVRELQEAVASRAKHGLSDETALLLIAPDGAKLAGNVTAWPRDFPAPVDWTPVSLHRDTEAEDESFLAFTTRLPSGHRLLLGGSLDGRGQMQTALLYALAAAFALAVPIGLVGSLVIVRKMNRMVDTIATLGQHIADGDLSRRVQTDGSGDPHDRLRASLNAMLSRIETLVEELRLLTDALAHDIRSPLMRISAHIERATRLPPGSNQLGSFEAISREVSSLLHMLESALEIGRAEAGIGREHFEVFGVTELLDDLREMYQPLAAEKDMVISLTPVEPLQLTGNRGLVARAVANLIDNAIKYGAGGGLIEIGATVQAGNAILAVSDRGSGIPASRRSEALRKFGRLDSARVSPGSGLGLALVNAVALLHGGKLVLDDNGPGLRATMVLKQEAEALRRPEPVDAKEARRQPIATLSHA